MLKCLGAKFNQSGYLYTTCTYNGEFHKGFPLVSLTTVPWKQQAHLLSDWMTIHPFTCSMELTPSQSFVWITVFFFGELKWSYSPLNNYTLTLIYSASWDFIFTWLWRSVFRQRLYTVILLFHFLNRILLFGSSPWPQKNHWTERLLTKNGHFWCE